MNGEISGHLQQMLLSLAIIIVLIGACRYVIRKVNLQNLKLKYMKMIDSLKLDKDNKIFLVQIGDTQQVFHLNNGEITVIKEFKTPMANLNEDPGLVRIRKLVNYFENGGQPKL